MIELKNNTLSFSCPEIHPDARLDIEFQRTLLSFSGRCGFQMMGPITPCPQGWELFPSSMWMTICGRHPGTGSSMVA